MKSVWYYSINEKSSKLKCSRWNEISKQLYEPQNNLATELKILRKKYLKILIIMLQYLQCYKNTIVKWKTKKWIVN